MPAYNRWREWYKEQMRQKRFLAGALRRMRNVKLSQVAHAHHCIVPLHPRNAPTRVDRSLQELAGLIVHCSAGVGTVAVLVCRLYATAEAPRWRPQPHAELPPIEGMGAMAGDILAILWLLPSS